MKKIKITAVLIFSLALMFTSCNETKKEVETGVIEKIEEVEETDKEEIQEASEEMAIAVYQCPMKCEGDKTFTEEGSCSVCKMDLKEVEVSDDDSEEENHEGHNHD